MTGATCEAGNDHSPEFMILPIHYIYTLYIYILLNLSVLGLSLLINDLFVAWINLTALSQTYFII